MNQIRSHINFNFQNDSHIAIPSDYILKRNMENVESDKPILKMAEFQKWIKEEIFDNEKLKALNFTNEKKEAKYKARKRLYIFVVAS